MRRDDLCRLAALAGAFGLGVLLALCRAYRPTLIIAALLLVLLCRLLHGR